ncbi:MAG: hypothetical protein L6R42_005947 [Xanthoria sp. 1 TBL-2021]|nr:MAG: hypothetical protein L6R42_005947 [Xanthoria sp. 1 TBL-2021]
MFSNNCQRLVDRLLDGKDFEYVFPRLPRGFSSFAPSEAWKHFRWPRYLISFGDRIEGQDISIRQPNSCVTKFCDRGLFTEDIIDFLELEIGQAEIKKGNHSFKDLKELALMTPQRNTEDYQKVAEDALWDLPRDSLSLIQYHLLRPHTKYSTITGKLFDRTQWIDGRLRALQQLDVIACYAGALGSALLEMFYHEPDMVSRITIPKSRIYGSLRADEKVRVFRSGYMVNYVISQRQDQSMWPIDTAERMFDAIQLTSKKYFHKAGTKAFNSRLFRSILMKILKSMTMQPPQGSLRLRYPSIVPNETFLTLYPLIIISLETMRIVSRDNWIYLSFGKILIAYQAYKKSKNVR